MSIEQLIENQSINLILDLCRHASLMGIVSIDAVMKEEDFNLLKKYFEHSETFVIQNNTICTKLKGVILNVTKHNKI